MRLLRLELTNFRNYSHLVIDFTQPRTILLGENGIGKSTIFDAISWAILGRCRGVDGKGAGQKDLIRLGADDMRVMLLTDTLGAVVRSISRTGSAAVSIPTDAILAKLNVSEAMMVAVLVGQAFFQMHHQDGKAMLMQLLDVRIQKADLPGVDLPDAVDDVDLAYLESLYDVAFKDRAARKAALAALHVPPAPKVVDIATGGDDVEQVKADLQVNQQGLATLASAIARDETQVKTLAAQLAIQEQLAASVEQLQGNLQTHQDMLEKHEADAKTAADEQAAVEAEPAEPVSALQIQLHEGGTLIDRIERHTANLTADAIPLAGPKRGKKKLVVADDAPHTCVLGGGIPCLTAPSAFIGAVEELRAAHKALEDRIRAGNVRASKLSAAAQAKKDADRHVTYHQTQVTALREKITAAERARAALADWRANLAKVRDSLTEQQKRRGDLVQETTMLADRLAQRAAYERDVQAHQDAVSRQADLKAQVDKAEALVALLGPKGVRATALQAALDDFHQAINAALAPFRFEIAINVEPWKVEINRLDDPGWLRFQLLSTGQQVWTALAFQLTLALLSGLDFCVIDTVENVVGKNRTMLTQLVMQAPVGQVLVAMAKGDAEDTPDIDGLQVLRAELAGQPTAA